MKSKLFSLLSLSYRCIVTVNVLWLFLTAPWAGLQCVIVVFSDHTHFLMNSNNSFVLLVYFLCLNKQSVKKYFMIKFYIPHS